MYDRSMLMHVFLTHIIFPFSREEQIFKRAFDGGLAQQRERLRELRRVTREQEEAANKQHKDTLDNMENLYPSIIMIKLAATVNVRTLGCYRGFMFSGYQCVFLKPLAQLS